MLKFSDLNLKPEVINTLKSINFTNPTEIQRLVLKPALNGKDVIGRSPTGSGKTHAFLIPIFNKLDTSKNEVQAVILTPTRELAFQIYEKIKPFLDEYKDARVKLLSSGLDRNKQEQGLNNVPHIIIGTPGRVTDLAFKKALFNITTCKTLVLDEADMILEEGFMEDIALIAGKMKSYLQMLVFSATMPEILMQFLNKYMNNPITIDPNKNEVTNKNVIHYAYPTRNKNRLEVLETLLRNINPFLCIIFASKKEDVDAIYRYLKGKKFNVGIIHGDLDNTTRKTMMKRINNLEFNYIVASDIASRGIDIEGVSHIVNYDLPYVDEFYFHRAGRTGRYNNDGVCFTLYSKDELKKVNHFIEKGVKFVNVEFIDGELKELKPFVRKKVNKPHPMNTEIKKTVNKYKNQPVKPGYKKKMKNEIDKIKRKHRREVIEADIKRQIKERAIKRTKEAKEMED